MSRRHFYIGLIVSLALHLMLAVFLLGFSSSEPKKIVKKTPNFVKAELVKLTSSPKKASEKQAAKKTVKIIDLTKKRKEKERLEQKRKADLKRKKDLAAKKERERKAAQEKKSKQLAEQQRLERERQDKLKEQELLAALKEEDDFLQAQSMNEMAQSYVAAMAERIENNWSRPPSARRGMECILSLQLVPSGEVVNVDLVKSSGNAAFDRSALQAVRKIDRFSELKGMDPQTFERHFRQLQLKFNPQDLRLSL